MVGYRNEKGFTLIEILIAITIFGMVASMVFMAFREIAVSAKTIDQSSRNQQIANACMMIINNDLEAVYVNQIPRYVKPDFNSEPDPYRFEGSNVIINTTQFPQIRFTTEMHLPVNRDFQAGIAEIVYYIDEKDDGELVLKRSDRLYFETDFEKKKNDPVLCRHIKAMNAKYYNAENEAFDEWDSESEEYGFATPSSVALSIVTGDDDERFTFDTRATLRSVRLPQEEK